MAQGEYPERITLKEGVALYGDFAGFQRCFTGACGYYPIATCDCFNRDGDDDIDLDDFDAFAACVSGLAIPADPACDD